MKKIIIGSIKGLLLISLCTGAFAAFQPEPKVMPYRDEEWHFDVEEKEYPYITVVPKDRTEPQVYGNGYVERVEPQKKKYDIVLLGQ